MSEGTPEKGKRSRFVRALQIAVGVLVGIVVLGAIVGGNKEASKTAATPNNAPVQPQAQALAMEKPVAVEPVVVEEASRLTGPQQNAVRSAEQYLSMTGFSRAGLIGQLSSDYGDGYSVADATIAVDSLTVDWNEQAARSAQQYLGMSGFSCKGLIGQLSSDHGDRYTKSQATYGAQQAGAC